MPTVTGFEAVATLASGRMGLRTQNNSTSRANLVGTGFSDGLTVNVWNTAAGSGSQPNWSGPLQLAGGQYFAMLKCTNSTVRKDEEPRDTEEVSVTVGTSPVYNNPNPVNEGPGP
jgi:hypothetical protein